MIARLRNIQIALVIVAIGLLGTTTASAQPREAPLADRLLAVCARWRVAESSGEVEARKPIGKATESTCRDLSDAWLARFAEREKAKEAGSVSRLLFDVCSDLAQRLAKRPVAIAWCSTWDWLRHKDFTPDPPDDIWDALDASPLENDLSENNFRRNRLLREVFERRLSNDWDQSEVEARLQSIGFECVRPKPGGPHFPFPPETSDALTSVCKAYLAEIVVAPTAPLFSAGLLIGVRIRFALSGEPRGRQQLEVRTGEARRPLRLGGLE